MIEYKHVSKVYGDGTEAVSDVSLTINKGELVVFIGTSGSGKTTSMRMINRMVEPSNGEILIDGENIMEKNPVDLRRSIGYVIQQTGLMPHMTVYENIIMVPKLLNWDEDKMEATARKLLEQVDMDPDQYMDRYPSELSGGQQQRIGVIRALAAGQEIILMDEPFGALDPITREALQEMVIELQKEMGRTVVFVTHDMDEALDLADRIAIMTDGKLVQYDTPENIIANPANDFVREFIGEDRLKETTDQTQVKDVMDLNPITVQLGTPLQEAVRVMKHHKLDSLLIVNEDNILHGVVDLMKIKSTDKEKLVDDVMRRPSFYMKPETHLHTITEMFFKRNMKFVAILGDSYELQGILTRSSMVNLFYSSVWGMDDVATDDTAVEDYDVQAIQADN